MSEGRGAARVEWLGRQDSNLNRGIQNPSCYRYTTAQYAF
jgi:hypothetical protein